MTDITTQPNISLSVWADGAPIAFAPPPGQSVRAFNDIDDRLEVHYVDHDTNSEVPRAVFNHWDRITIDG